MMNTEKLRSAAPGRAHRAINSEGLSGTFDSRVNNETSESQESTMPIGETRSLAIWVPRLEALRGLGDQ